MLICLCHKVARKSFCLICEVFTTKSCERHLWIYFFFQKPFFESCDNRNAELRAGLMGAKGVINQKMKEKERNEECFTPFFVLFPLVLLTLRSRSLCLKLDFMLRPSSRCNSEKSFSTSISTFAEREEREKNFFTISHKV